jgi:hypothetical protein
MSLSRFIFLDSQNTIKYIYVDIIQQHNVGVVADIKNQNPKLHERHCEHRREKKNKRIFSNVVTEPMK